MSDASNLMKTLKIQFAIKPFYVKVCKLICIDVAYYNQQPPDTLSL